MIVLKLFENADFKAFTTRTLFGRIEPMHPGKTGVLGRTYIAEPPSGITATEFIKQIALDTDVEGVYIKPDAVPA